jgi:hypothetical protein
MKHLQTKQNKQIVNNTFSHVGPKNQTRFLRHRPQAQTTGPQATNLDHSNVVHKGTRILKTQSHELRKSR